jgi:DNA-binding PadR family transcriptional regulator
MQIDFEQVEMLELDTLAEFDVLAKRFRLSVLRAMNEPKSVSEAAEFLKVPVTRLYYHVNELHRGGFLTLLEVRKAGARTERVYQATAKGIRPSQKFLEDYGAEGITAVIKLVLGVVEAGFARAVEAGDFGHEPDDEKQRRGTIGLASLFLSDDLRHKLITEIEGLSAKYSELSDRGEPPIEFFYGAYPS